MVAACRSQSNRNRNILRLLGIVLAYSFLFIAYSFLVTFKQIRGIDDSFTDVKFVSKRSSSKNITAEAAPSNKTTAISPTTTTGSILSSVADPTRSPTSQEPTWFPTSRTTSGSTTDAPTLAPSNSIPDAVTLPPSEFPERWGPCDPRKIESYLPQGNIWIVSFAGWEQERKQNTRDVGRSVDGWLGGKVLPLLYTENDLPPSYYERFNWSYAKPDYRGFWTWKPWILRNLTETGVFKAGDVVLWFDSDRKFKHKRHLRTALCNMEHRNQNYAGVFPFRRCQGHVASEYTKPEVFVRMGLNRTEWGKGEQYYAGAIGFHINQDTLAFLKEWEDWGTIPEMFGDDEDFPGNPPWSGVYRKHKNDQSVFSLMCQMRNMKAWPSPYYDSRRCGINGACHKDYQDAGYCFFLEDHPKVCKPLEDWMQNLPLS